MPDTAERCRAFRHLHASGCFVMPNPWDPGSARAFARLGFPALATTSAGFAWTRGRRDNHVTLDEALEHMREIAGSVEVPVNADFEGGFAVEPAEVAANVRRAAGTGVAGLSIEDSTGDPANPLFEFTLAVERVGAARRDSTDDQHVANRMTLLAGLGFGLLGGLVGGLAGLGGSARRRSGGGRREALD